MPSSACLPLAASGPVSDIAKPIVIGLPLWATAEATNAIAAIEAGREPGQNSEL